MSDWGHDSEQLFRNAKRGLTPSQGHRARVRARIAAKVGAAGLGLAGAVMASSKAAGATAPAAASAGAGGGAGAGAGAVAAKGLTLALVAKIVGPIVIAGAVVAVTPRIAGLATASAPAPVNAPVTSHAPVATSTAASLGTPTPTATPYLGGAASLPTVDIAALPAASAPAEVPAPPRVSSTAPSAAITAEEALLVGDIDTALRANDAATALRLAAEHERRFPRGVLSEEREGARVMARCMTGAQATSGASAFLAAHPRTPMRARIVAACGR